MPDAGYYRDPTIQGDTVVFVCEDDLWTVPATGGVARRLTANPGPVATPALSPDGAWLAFVGRDEGSDEAYVMPAAGGSARRLTYFGGQVHVVGWNPDSAAIIVASSAAQPFADQLQLYAVALDGGDPTRLPIGLASSISYGPGGGVVIGRNTTDIAYWKRYRGGRTGDLWIDTDGDGQWRKLIQLAGNLAVPLWLGGRIYFVSDHEGIGNLYSCTPAGADLRRHTHHSAYYVRHPATDGQRIVYHAGADLYVFDPASGAASQIAIEFYSPHTQRKRKFVQGDQYLEGSSLHPKGSAIAVTTRGKVFTLGNWDGAAVQHGDSERARYRLATWLHDGKRLAIVGDAGGEDMLEIHSADASEPPLQLGELDIGRPVAIAASPKRDQLALANHRNQLLLVDIAAASARVLDTSRHARIHDVAWSPDGQWLAYTFQETQQVAIIKLCRVETGETWPVTKPLLDDRSPSFDPGGKYLYFISCRDFNPVRDNIHFEFSFPRGERPFLLTLQADTPSPFGPPNEESKSEGQKNGESKQEAGEEPKDEEAGDDKSDKKDASEQVLRIDLEGIAERLVAFPVPEGRYRRVRGIKGKVLFVSFPIEGSLGGQQPGDNGPKGKIEIYDLAERRVETLINGVSGFAISQDASTLIYQARNRLRVLKAGEKPKDEGSPGRRSGWVDLQRIRVSVEPRAEWEQMYREAWRLQRDQFWTADMSGVDWLAVYQRYLPLLNRVATRAEFSDLVLEMQGELGTSHAYVRGGDHRPGPRYDQGFLGADLHYDSETDSYRIGRIIKGDTWDEQASSPLARPGVNIKPGDRLLAIGGRRVGRALAPQELLVHQAASEVLLTIAPADGGTPRVLTVKTLRSERAARYREWVESNRQRVHQATEGRVGYIHIPDMGPHGFAEFHRGYLAEVVRDGMIVDVRFNRGGFVSHLLLEKLARQRLGYSVPRWGEPFPYPYYALLGPLVALANEQAGSDGDIFSHAFKMLGLGPLIGKRTWGGVIGISPRSQLADGGDTTQPEHSFWFKDVGWRVENYGTDPDIEVDIAPQDHVAGRDTQLDRAIDEVLRRMAEQPPVRPDFSERPRLLLPELPEL